MQYNGCQAGEVSVLKSCLFSLAGDPGCHRYGVFFSPPGATVGPQRILSKFPRRQIASDKQLVE